MLHDFIDVVCLEKQRIKDNKKFSIEALDTDFLDEGNNESLHNVFQDGRVLGELLRKLEISDAIVREQSKDVGFMLKKKQSDQVTESLNKTSLQEYRSYIS